MKFRECIERVLSCRGILYLATRFGGTSLRRLAFAGNYASGRWGFLDSSTVSEMVQIVEKHASGGKILDMGCGTGSLAAALTVSSYSFYQGIDICPSAIEKAENRGIPNAQFQCGDIQTFQGGDRYDLIVFEETLYYVNPLFRHATLRRFAEMLDSNGTIVITIAEPDRFAGMIHMIESNFQVTQRKRFRDSKRQYLILESC